MVALISLHMIVPGAPRVTADVIPTKRLEVKAFGEVRRGKHREAAGPELPVESWSG